MELDLLPLNLPSDNEKLTVIAGPCSAETEEQVIETARQLAYIYSVPVCGSHAQSPEASRATVRPLCRG